MTIELSIVSDMENKLLDRRGIEFTVTSDGATPKNAEVRAALAAKLGVPESHVLVEHVYQRMGAHTSKGAAKVYKAPIVEKKKKGETKEGEGAAEAKK